MDSNCYTTRLAWMYIKVLSKGNSIIRIEFIGGKKLTYQALLKETITSLTVFLYWFVLLQPPALPPSPGSWVGQTYVSTDDPSASWHRIGGAVKHEEVGPHLPLSLRMLLSLSPTQALMSHSLAVAWQVCCLTCSTTQPPLFLWINCLLLAESNY